MKLLLLRIKEHRYFIGFLLLFAYAESIQVRILIRRDVNAYTFTPDAAIGALISIGFLFVIMRFFLTKYINGEGYPIKKIVSVFMLSLVTYVILNNLFSFVIAIAFDTVSKNFNTQVLVSKNFGLVLDAIIYGSFYLAYYFNRRHRMQQQQLVAYHEALSEVKISQLKSQLNPHFLFNNLNILDQLIEEDGIKASTFLNDFSELYRYVLYTSDKQLVSLQEELQFAQSYIDLIKHKYGDAYLFTIRRPQNMDGFIPPLTLQLLLENAVQHNIGTRDKPILIEVFTEDQMIIVSNTCAKKKQVKTNGGRALKNLTEQYILLTDRSIQIVETAELFSENLPIIKSTNQ